MTHICVSKLSSVGSDNGLSVPSHYLNQCWNIVIWTLRNKFIFSSKKMHLKMSSGKWRPFCLGLNELIELEWLGRVMVPVLVFQHASRVSLTCFHSTRELLCCQNMRCQGCEYTNSPQTTYVSETDLYLKQVGLEYPWCQLSQYHEISLVILNDVISKCDSKLPMISNENSQKTYGSFLLSLCLLMG